MAGAVAPASATLAADGTVVGGESHADYLRRHKIPQLFEASLKRVLEERCADPFAAFVEHLAAERGDAAASHPAAEAAALRSEVARLQAELAAAKAAAGPAPPVPGSGMAAANAAVDLMCPLLSVVLDTDSYKFCHWKQYPPGTTAMHSYFESRGGAFPAAVFFGLQYYLRRYLARPITAADVAAASAFAAAHSVPFNTAGWSKLVANGGHLPVVVRAVPEGSVVPASNVLLTVESRDPDLFWVVSYLETMLVRLWYPTTVATNSWTIRRHIDAALQDTAEDTNGDFKLHDFGARGVSSQETAMLGGMAHLVSFCGSDTVAGVWTANVYYDCPMAGYSIPASEHSTITMWTQAGEEAAYRNMIQTYGGGDVFACVSDSYDVFHAVEGLWGGALKGEVEAMKATLVVRPDSGDPAEVCVKVAAILDDKFGSRLNAKGYKVLNKVRIIQGDGVDLACIREVLAALKDAGFSSENIAFGSGGALLQRFHRDVMRFAFKCSWALVGGVPTGVFKAPATDPTKRSKSGRLDLVAGAAPGDYRTVTLGDDEMAAPGSVMQTVYENGVILKMSSFEAVRAAARAARAAAPVPPPDASDLKRPAA